MTNMTRPEFYDESGEHKQVVGKDSVGTLENLKKINTENINSDTANIETANISDSINVNNKFTVDQNGNVTANGDINVNGNIKTIKSVNVNDNFTVNDTGQVTAKEYDGDKSQIGNIIIEGNTITAVEGERIDILDYRLYRHVITLTNVQCDDFPATGTLFFTIYSTKDTPYTNLDLIRFTEFGQQDPTGFSCTGGCTNSTGNYLYNFNYLYIDHSSSELSLTIKGWATNLNQNTITPVTLTLNTYSIDDEVFRTL